MADGKKCNNEDCKVLVTEYRKDGQYEKYCSLSCQCLGVTKKTKKTSLERYRVSNLSKSTIVKDCIKDSFAEKYGADITNAMHLQEFRNKIADFLTRYFGYFES